MPEPTKIDINNASFMYRDEHIFENLCFSLKTGKITCLLGPSGVGKSSLIRMLAGLTSGSFELNIDTSTLHQQIAYLPQQETLLPWLTALDNTIIGAKLRNHDIQNLKKAAKLLFEKMGLQHTEKKYPHELSGGMRQRVALIRTLIEDKPIVLMDEPFAALDAITRFEIQNLACELLKNKTVLLVTHDPLEALRVADEIYILSGKPAKLTLFTTLASATPRDFANPDIINHQALLFDALTKAKEMNL